MVFSIFQTLEAQRHEKLFLEARNNAEREQKIAKGHLEVSLRQKKLNELLRAENERLKDSLKYFKNLLKKR